jgi:hypothetical protein
LHDWFRRSRLEAYTDLFERTHSEEDPVWNALQARLKRARGPGYERMGELLRGRRDLIWVNPDSGALAQAE